jgi:hypothetical protein
MGLLYLNVTVYQRKRKPAILLIIETLTAQKKKKKDRTQFGTVYDFHNNLEDIIKMDVIAFF